MARACNIDVGEEEWVQVIGGKTRAIETTKMDLWEIGCSGMEWPDLAQDKGQ
jgi:hypothetical protein